MLLKITSIVVVINLCCHKEAIELPLKTGDVGEMF